MQTPQLWIGKRVNHLDWYTTYSGKYGLCDCCQRFYPIADCCHGFGATNSDILGVDTAEGFCQECYNFFADRLEEIFPDRAWVEMEG